MEEACVWELLASSGSYKKGHFVLNSGYHSDRFIEKVLATADPEVRYELANAIVDWTFGKKSLSAEVIVGSPMGAITLAAEVSSWCEAPVVWLEKKPVIKRGQIATKLRLRDANRKLVKDKEVLLVEDVITKGTNTEEALEVLEKAGAKVVAVACIVNREDYEPPKGIEFLYLAHEPPEGAIISWLPDACPLCEKGVSINTDSGHGQEFLEKISTKNPTLYEKLTQG